MAQTYLTESQTITGRSIDAVTLSSINYQSYALLSFLKKNKKTQELDIKSVRIDSQFYNYSTRIIFGSFKTDFDECFFCLKFENAEFQFHFRAMSNEYHSFYRIDEAKQEMRQLYYKEVTDLIQAGLEWEDFMTNVDAKLKDDEFVDYHEFHLEIASRDK